MSPARYDEPKLFRGVNVILACVKSYIHPIHCLSYSQCDDVTRVPNSVASYKYGIHKAHRPVCDWHHFDI